MKKLSLSRLFDPRSRNSLYSARTCSNEQHSSSQPFQSGEMFPVEYCAPMGPNRTTRCRDLARAHVCYVADLLSARGFYLTTVLRCAAHNLPFLEGTLRDDICLRVVAYVEAFAWDTWFEGVDACPNQQRRKDLGGGRECSAEERRTMRKNGPPRPTPRVSVRSRQQVVWGTRDGLTGRAVACEAARVWYLWPWNRATSLA